MILYPRFTMSKEKQQQPYTSFLRQKRLSRWRWRRSLLYQSILLAVLILLLNMLLRYQIPANKRQSKNYPLEEWKGLAQKTPKPNKNERDWIAKQGQLYKHIGEMRRFMNTLDSKSIQVKKVMPKIGKELLSIERKAFSFIDSGKKGYSSPLDMLQQAPLWNGKYQRGLVVVAGDPQYRYLLHLLSSLRTVLNSNIPVEVFYRGSEDLAPDQRKSIESFGNVITKDLLAVKYFKESETDLKNATYSLKPYALLASDFQEPILCDADVVFLQDPYKLYHDAGYCKTGTLFYYDRLFRGLGLRAWLKTQYQLTNQTASHNLKKSVFWNSDIDGNVQDSGVVLINKMREDVLLSFMFAAWMNGKQQREYLEKIMWGEKETYWLSYELTSQPYSFAPKHGGGMGQLIRDTNNIQGMELDNILHFDRHLQPLWANGGLLKSKNWPQSPWLEVDTIGIDGKWYYGQPLWTYIEAKWTPAPRVGELVEKMVKVAKEMDAKYNPRVYGYVKYINDKKP